MFVYSREPVLVCRAGSLGHGESDELSVAGYPPVKADMGDEQPDRGWWEALLEAKLVSTASVVVRRYADHTMGMHAAAVSFWAMLSLVPLVAMVTFGVALFVDTGTIDTFLDEASATVPGETIELVSEQVRVWAAISAQWSAGILVIAALAASWGASAAVGQLVRAINIAHERPPRSYAKRRLTGLLRTISALVLVIPMVLLIAATPSALDAADVSPLVGWTIAIARWPLIVLLFILLLSGLYWSAPSERERFRLLTPGVTVASVVFLTGSVGFAVYAAGADSYDERYGSLATVVVTMLWLYVTNSAVLLGAEVDAAFPRGSAASGETAGGEGV